MRRSDVRDAAEAQRRAAGLRSEPADPVAVGLRLGSAVTRTLNTLPTDSRCLAQSLTLLELLARRGISGTLVIGARPRPEFSAHAWVEYKGAPLLEPGEYAEQRLVEL